MLYCGIELWEDAAHAVVITPWGEVMVQWILRKDLPSFKKLVDKLKGMEKEFCCGITVVFNSETEVDDTLLFLIKDSGFSVKVIDFLDLYHVYATFNDMDSELSSTYLIAALAYLNDVKVRSLLSSKDFNEEKIAC